MLRAGNPAQDLAQCIALPHATRIAEQLNKALAVGSHQTTPETVIALRTAPAIDRRSGILESATRSFSIHGFRGANLRDIAKDAGVSLTLLDHHFGSKAMLLEAVVNAHRAGSLKQIASLKLSLMSLDGALTVGRLVDEWVDYEFELSNSRHGRHNLHLMLKLTADSDMDPLLREGLNCSEGVFCAAFGHLRPDLDQDSIRGAWVLASSALYAAVLNADELFLQVDTSRGPNFREETKAFLQTGLTQYAQVLAGS
jgi:AcrR family transcriptional regulator